MAGSNCASAGGSITLPSTTSVVPVALQQLRLQLNLRTPLMSQNMTPTDHPHTVRI